MNLSTALPNIVVVDDFYESPLDVRTYALQQPFFFHPSDHKGQRTEQRHCFPGVKERFEQLLGARVTNWDTYGYNGVFQICMAGEQIVYHSDRQQYAAVVFLTPDAPPNSGTNLYRSRATGLREVNPQTALARGMTVEQASTRTFNGKLLDPTAWELVDSIGNVFNRCAIWNGHLIHAAANYFGTTAFNARLFQMFFFDAEPWPVAPITSLDTPPVLPNIIPEEMLPLSQEAAELVRTLNDVPNRPMTPQEMLTKAEEIAKCCQKLPGVERMQLLNLVARINDALCSVVKTQLKAEGTSPDGQ